MAIYHCSIKNISRSSGKSAIASAAYRAGEKLEDQETGLMHDYTQKKEVIHSEIFLCENAPKEYRDRETLWNAVEEIEKQSNARLAREWEVALPNELNLDQSKKLVRDYAQSLADEGMCVDASIHWKDGNHHAHIMGTTRPIKPNGEWGQKEKKAYKLDGNGQKIPQIDPQTGKQKIGARGRKMWQRETVEANDWNKSNKVEEWRERWAEHCNRYLSQGQQIDHRSYAAQGIDQIPTIHEGYAARQMEEKGQTAERCNINREIGQKNQKLCSLQEKEKAMDAEKKTLAQIIQEWRGKIYERIRRFKADRALTGPAGADERRKRGIAALLLDVEVLEREVRFSSAAFRNLDREAAKQLRKFERGKREAEQGEYMASCTTPKVYEAVKLPKNEFERKTEESYMDEKTRDTGANEGITGISAYPEPIQEAYKRLEDCFGEWGKLQVEADRREAVVKLFEEEGFGEYVYRSPANKKDLLFPPEFFDVLNQKIGRILSEEEKTALLERKMSRKREKARKKIRKLQK